MRLFLVVAQIVVSCALAGLILLQAKGTGLGNSALFGGSGEFYSSVHRNHRFDRSFCQPFLFASHS